MRTPFTLYRQSATPNAGGQSVQVWSTVATATGFIEPASSRQIESYGTLGMQVDWSCYTFYQGIERADKLTATVAGKLRTFLIQSETPYQAMGGIPSYSELGLQELRF